MEVKCTSALLVWNKCKDENFGWYKLFGPSTDPNFDPQDDGSPGITDRDKTEQHVTGLSPETTYYFVLKVQHEGQVTTERTSFTTPECPPFEVDFGDQLARACAGGVAVDGVHNFSIVGTAKRPDGSLVTNTAIKFTFRSNKGHDYGDGREKKLAKFITSVNGQQQLVEEMTATTDNEGKVGVSVLSSDIVSNDIEIVGKWTNEQGQDKEVGSKACDFDEAVSLRRFPDPTGNDAGDNGWIFDFPNLTEPGDRTPAKIYMKFMKDPDKGDVDGNWAFVNGHNLLLEIEDVDPKEGSTDSSSDMKDYATIVVPNVPDAISSNVVTANDGAAQIIIEAGPLNW